jgi:hypothetical protein
MLVTSLKTATARFLLERCIGIAVISTSFSTEDTREGIFQSLFVLERRVPNIR